MITLFTNLSYASTGGMRCHVDAVIIEPPGDVVLGGKYTKVRGFGPDRAWPVFDIFLKTESTAYEVVETESTAIFIGENEDGTSRDPQPLFRGGLIRFEDGTELHLTKGTFDERPIDVSEHPGAEDHYESLWKALDKKTALYSDTPNMPTLKWMSSDMVRILRGVAGQEV